MISLSGNSSIFCANSWVRTLHLHNSHGPVTPEKTARCPWLARGCCATTLLNPFSTAQAPGTVAEHSIPGGLCSCLRGSGTKRQSKLVTNSVQEQMKQKSSGQSPPGVRWFTELVHVL